MKKENRKDLGMLIINILLLTSVFYFMFAGLNVFLDHLQEKEVKDSQFCKNKNLSYYMVVDNGFAGSKVICIGPQEKRQEYYLEEIYN